MRRWEWKVGNLAVVDGGPGRQRLVRIERITQSGHVVTSDCSSWYEDGKNDTGSDSSARLRTTAEVRASAERQIAASEEAVTLSLAAMERTATELAQAAAQGNMIKVQHLVYVVVGVAKDGRRSQQDAKEAMQILDMLSAWKP